MKLLNTMIGSLILLSTCQPPQDNTANEAFERNSKIVQSYIEGYQSEKLNYDDWYADDVVILGTAFGAPDSISLDYIKEQDKIFLADFDLELTTELILLPGVNVDTKKMDGSVRYYGDWKMIKPATDSTEEKSATVKVYESFDFNEEGKIVFQQSYGDMATAYAYMVSEEKDEEQESEMQ